MECAVESLLRAIGRPHGFEQEPQLRIVGQLAVSVVVLVTAALFGQTLNQLRRVDPGFEPERILLASIAPTGYSLERRKAFYARLIEDVRRIPGVTSAALANDEPLNVKYRLEHHGSSRIGR